jgi:putative membrane protein
MESDVFTLHSIGIDILHWIVSAAAIMGTAKIVPGFRVKSFGSAMWAAVAIAIAYALLHTLLIILTLPINILTLGLFTFVINGAILKIAAVFLDGFEIDGWFAAIIGSIVLSLLSWALHSFLI